MGAARRPRDAAARARRPGPPTRRGCLLGLADQGTRRPELAGRRPGPPARRG
jgi:hypothetical protein